MNSFGQKKCLKCVECHRYGEDHSFLMKYLFCKVSWNHTAVKMQPGSFYWEKGDFDLKLRHLKHRCTFQVFLQNPEGNCQAPKWRFWGNSSFFPKNCDTFHFRNRRLNAVEDDLISKGKEICIYRLNQNKPSGA